MVRVLIGASSEVTRTGLETMLSSDPHLEIIGSFSTQELCSQIESLQPEIVVLETQPSPEDLEQLFPAKENWALPPMVLLLPEFPIEALSGELIHFGIRAILPPEATFQEMVAAVEAVSQGMVVVHPQLIGP